MKQIWKWKENKPDIKKILFGRNIYCGSLQVVGLWVDSESAGLMAEEELLRKVATLNVIEASQKHLNRQEWRECSRKPTS